MGREAYSSSNNIWSAKRAAYRRIICCKTLMMFWEFFRLFISFCFYGFDALFYLFILWLFMQFASLHCLPELTTLRKFYPYPQDLSDAPKHIVVKSRKKVSQGNQTRPRLLWNPNHISMYYLPSPICPIPTPNMVLCTLPSTHLLPLSLFRHVASKRFQPPQIFTARTASESFEGPENVLPP